MCDGGLVVLGVCFMTWHLGGGVWCCCCGVVSRGGHVWMRGGGGDGGERGRRWCHYVMA
jgi:hypothetical protein